MADLFLSCVISRAGLGLPDLEINDGYIYQASTQFLGAAVNFNRQQATSPYIDGAVTVARTLEMVTEPLAVEVWGRTGLDATLKNSYLRENMNILTAAFWQDSFTLTITVEDALYAYRAEAADVQLAWVGNRFIAKKGLITFTVPRQPRSLVDGLL